MFLDIIHRHLCPIDGPSPYLWTPVPTPDRIYKPSTAQSICKVSYVRSFLIFECFVLALADGMCCAWLVYPIRCWYRGPEIRTNSKDWVQLNKFHLKTEIESSLRKVVFLNKSKTMDSVQKRNVCIR
jgi:hypothetical protein